MVRSGMSKNCAFLLGTGRKVIMSAEVCERTSTNPGARGQAGHLHESACGSGGLCEALEKIRTKICTLWIVFIYPQEHLYLSLIWLIAGSMSNRRENNGVRVPIGSEGLFVGGKVL